MNTAEALSVAAVVISAVSVLVGLLRFRHERKMADRENGREVLAAGALALGQAKATIRKVHSAFRVPLGDLSQRWPDDFGEQLAEVLTSVERLEATVAALRVRFPASDSIVVEAGGALADTQALYQLYWHSHGRAFNQNQDRDADRDAELGRDLNESYGQHEDKYLAAAQRAVGVKL